MEETKTTIRLNKSLKEKIGNLGTANESMEEVLSRVYEEYLVLKGEKLKNAPR